MGSIIRMLERGLIGVFTIVTCIVSMIMSRCDFDGLSWMSIYVGLYVMSFIVYKSCFGVVLYKLQLLHEAIRLGVYSGETVKDQSSAVKINNDRLFKNKHYRIQVTEKLIRNLKFLTCIGKKICRVSSAYAAFHIDHPLVLIECIMAMQGNHSTVEVFRRRLSQIGMANSSWLTTYLREGLKKNDSLRACDDAFIVSMCHKIAIVYMAYDDDVHAQILIYTALEGLIQYYHTSKWDAYFFKARIQRHVSIMRVQQSQIRLPAFSEDFFVSIV